MFYSRTVLWVVLICAVGLISGTNAHRRKVRSPFTLEMQKAVEKAAKEQVRFAAVVGRAVKILPPKPDNETVGEGNSTSTARESSPFAIFETIPLKIVSVVKPKQDEATTETAEPTTSKPAAVAAVVKLAEVEDEDVPEELPKSEALKASGTKQSEDVKSQAGSQPSSVTGSKIPATADSDSDATEPDSVAADPAEEAEDAEDPDDEVDSDGAEAGDGKGKSDI